MLKPVFENKNKGPLQIVHDFRFTALNVKDDYSFLDTLSHEEKLCHMKKRVKRLCELGYGGIVLNVDHINYLESQESFERVKEISLYAKELGIKVWIYDEQYYPSGAAGGHTLKNHSELESSAISMVEKSFIIKEGEGAIRVPSPLGHSSLKFAVAVPVVDGKEIFDKRLDVSQCTDIAGGLCFYAPAGEWKVYCFFLRVLFEATKFCQGTRASRRYINIRDKNAVKRFYDVTFENGYNKLFEKLGDVVEAIFTDEPYTPLYISWKNRKSRTAFESFSVYDMSNNDIPVYPFVPWQENLPKLFKERYGYDLSTALLDIFKDTPDAKRVKCDFYSLLSDMSYSAYPEFLQESLEENGVNLSGHYYGEEGFDVHPFYYGDILEHLSKMGIPGCDNLRSEADALRYCNACKLASSAAHISGKDRVMIEASNMMDKNQDITLKIAKGAVSMMFVHGINLITSYYGERLFPDDEMKEFIGYISNLSSLFDGGKYCADTFLYYPFDELCATSEPEGVVEVGDGFHDKFGVMETSKKLMEKQITFDYINSKRLLNSKICDGYVLSPNGNKIYNIVIPETGFIQNEKLNEYLKIAEEKGVNVFFDCKGETLDIVSGDVSLANENPYITFMHKTFESYDLYMLMNTKDESFVSDITVPYKEGNSFITVNPETMETTDILVKINGKTAEIHIDFKPLEPVIICQY